MMGQTLIVKRTLLLLTAMLAALVLASGVAFAVNKVCPSGTTEQNPCSGTKKIDTLIGTNGPDYIKGLKGNDNISGRAGNDTTDGGAGNDTYSYENGWGTDTLIDASGTDHLNLSVVSGDVYAALVPELLAAGEEYGVYGPNSAAEHIDFSGSPTIEKVTGGSSGHDFIITGKEANTLRPGPGTGGAQFADLGGASSSSFSLPASNDLYTGFSASGYGHVSIMDYGGTADKLVLPFASTDVYFTVSNSDNDPADDNLLIKTSSTDTVFIYGQLDPHGSINQIKGHIEQIQFTDTTLSIGGETQAQTLSAAKTADSSAEAQVEKLNEASSLDAAEKEKREEAAKKIAAEAEKKAQDLDEKLSASGGGQKR